ncbi:hypothetical protein ABW21_db0206474 [Orbilia brochopaga]|nr:hypothetical protein ABW21_db0206474 [Drechslerella brochopaga]
MQHLNTPSIPTLPVELRIRILEHLQDPPALFAALLSCHALHDAYRESSMSIRAAILLNATSVTSQHCMFLAYALLVFHDRAAVPLEELRCFVGTYLNFTNPINGAFDAAAYEIVPWRRKMPNGMRELQDKVHECIFSYARMFCEDHWKRTKAINCAEKEETASTRNKTSICNGKGKGRAGTNVPWIYNTAVCAAGTVQVATVARAFYRYWLYCILCRGKYFRYEDIDNLGRPICGRPDESLMLALVESMPVADFTVILRGVARFVRDLVRPRYLEFVADAKNPVRLQPALYRVSSTTLVSKDCQAIQAQISRLGPLALQEFLFTADRQRQWKIYCEEADAIDECLWIPWITMDNERRKAHAGTDCIFREIGECDSTPWEDHTGDWHVEGQDGGDGSGGEEFLKLTLDPSRYTPWVSLHWSLGEELWVYRICIGDFANYL